MCSKNATTKQTRFQACKCHSVKQNFRLIGYHNKQREKAEGFAEAGKQ